MQTKKERGVSFILLLYTKEQISSSKNSSPCVTEETDAEEYKEDDRKPASERRGYGSEPRHKHRHHLHDVEENDCRNAQAQADEEDILAGLAAERDREKDDDDNDHRERELLVVHGLRVAGGKTRFLQPPYVVPCLRHADFLNVDRSVLE